MRASGTVTKVTLGGRDDPSVPCGAMMAVAAHVSYAVAGQVTPHIVPLIVGQVLMAGVIATFGVLGITVAQRLVPTRVGMATSVS